MEINSEAKSHFEAGEKLFKEEKHPEAIQEYIAAMQIEPGYIEARINYLSSCVLGNFSYDQKVMEVEFNKAIEIIDKNPNNENNNKFRFETYFFWGQLYSKLQKYDLAIQKYEETKKLYDIYIEISPDPENLVFITINLFHANALFALNKYKENIEICEKTIPFAQKSTMLPSILAGCAASFHKLENFEEANKKYKEALSLNISDIDIQVSILSAYSVLLIDTEKYEEAIEQIKIIINYIDQIEEKSKQFIAKIYSNYGYALLGLNRYNEAIEKFNKISEIDATNTNGWFGIAEVYLKQKDFDKFDEPYNKILDIAKNNIQGIDFLFHFITTTQKLITIDPALLYIHTLWGDKLYIHGLYKGATEEYKKNATVIEIVKLISFFLRDKKHRNSLTNFFKFYQFLNNPKYFFILGNLHYTFFYDLDKAEYMYLKGLEADDKNVEILINLGHLYQEKHRNSNDGNKYYWKAQNILNQGKNILEKMLLSNDNSSILLQLGKVCILLKDYDKAEEYVTQAYQKNKKNSLSAMGLVYLYKKEFYKAINYYKELLEIEQHNISARINLASIYFQQNEYENAEVEYKQVLGIAPRNVEAHIGLGEIYINLGNQHNESKYYSQALGYFEKAIEISSSNNKSKKLNNMELASVHYFIGYAKLKLYLIANNARSFLKLKSAQRSFRKCLKYDKSNSQAHLMVKNISERLLPLYRDYGIATLFIIFAILFSWGIYLFNLDKEKDIIIWLVPIALAALGLYFPSITKFKVGDIEIEKSPAKETTSIFSGVDIEKVSLEKEKMIIPTPSLNIIK